MQISFSLNNNIFFFPLSVIDWSLFSSPPCITPPHASYTELALQIIAVEKCCQGAHSLPNFLPLNAQNAATITASGERTAPVELNLQCLT